MLCTNERRTSTGRHASPMKLEIRERCGIRFQQFFGGARIQPVSRPSCLTADILSKFFKDKIDVVRMETDKANNSNNNLLFIHTLLNLNRNSKVRAVSSLRTFSTPIPWHDLIHTLLGAKSLLSATRRPIPHILATNFLVSENIPWRKFVAFWSDLQRRHARWILYSDRRSAGINRHLSPFMCSIGRMPSCESEGRHYHTCSEEIKFGSR